MLLLIPTLLWGLSNSGTTTVDSVTDNQAINFWSGLSHDQQILWVKRIIAVTNDNPVFPSPEYSYVLDKKGELTFFPVYPTGKNGVNFSIGGFLNYTIPLPTYHYQLHLPSHTIQNLSIGFGVGVAVGVVAVLFIKR